MSAAVTDVRDEGASQPLKVVPLKHPVLRVFTVVVTLIALYALYSIVRNKNFQWGVIGHYFFSPAILKGVGNTIYLTIIAMAIGIVLGLVLAFMRLSPSRFLAGCAGFYIWIFRGTPLLVQIIVLYNVSVLYPTISFGVPFGPTFVHAQSNSVISPFLAAIAALGLNEAAYMSEIIRGGLLAVDPGQTEAAQSLGLPMSLIRRRIIIPQAMRSILPPTGNQVISLLKATSMVSVIASYDLLYAVESIYSRTYQTIPLLLVATLWYLVIVSVLMVIQSRIENHYSRGTTRNTDKQPGFLARFTARGRTAGQTA
jgi:polar amino acid transport system permease protein